MNLSNTIARHLSRGSLLVCLGLAPCVLHASELPTAADLDDGIDMATQTSQTTQAMQTPLNMALDAKSNQVSSLLHSQLKQLYALQQGQFVWQSPQRVETLLELLGALGSEGLVPADYQPELLRETSRQALAPEAGDDQRIRFDLQASGTLLVALGHLQRGRVSPKQVYRSWEIPAASPSLDLAAILDAITQGQVEQVLALARPNNPDYQGLRLALERYRKIAAQGGWLPLPERKKAPLRLGDEHDEVVWLRRRLAATGEEGLLSVNVSHYPGMAIEVEVSRHYDAELLSAVRRFQRRHMLSDDGVVGSQTRQALSVPAEQRVATLRANLERARWLGEPLHGRHIAVDLAGQQLSYTRDNGEHWETRVVVGRSSRQTPVLESEITHLTLNPTWTIPPTIMREDVLPRVRRDPGYLNARGYAVISASGKQLDPRSINWSSPGNVMLRQSAGRGNPLGRMVLRFPNDHLVYLHDTPARGLFSRAQRALSSGCIRVEGVAELAKMLFADTGTRADLSSLLATGRTRNVSLEKPVPLVMYYWTARALEGGPPSFRPDVYGRDPALITSLQRPLTL